MRDEALNIAETETATPELALPRDGAGSGFNRCAHAGSTLCRHVRIGECGQRVVEVTNTRD